RCHGGGTGGDGAEPARAGDRGARDRWGGHLRRVAARRRGGGKRRRRGVAAGRSGQVGRDPQWPGGGAGVAWRERDRTAGRVTRRGPAVLHVVGGPRSPAMTPLPA